MFLIKAVLLNAFIGGCVALAPDPVQQQDRRRLFEQALGAGMFSSSLAVATAFPVQSEARCTDIESCREIGEKKVERDLQDNPVVALANGVRYKLLKPGFGEREVEESSTIDLIYVVNTPARYMFSQGFGYEKVDVGFGKQESDLGIDSYRVTLGTRNLPLGVEQALIGMKKGERRKVEVPPGVGFDSSDWKPEPRTALGRQVLDNYKKLLRGSGPNNPPFAAPTIWQVEVLNIR
mmetsp:Transcript_19623/g.55394  ORF Transcript_19623/g.55394 Transcript_19623/m.55394 type:complete len:235 (-) Transcript_19623:83-787(-)